MIRFKQPFAKADGYLVAYLLFPGLRLYLDILNFSLIQIQYMPKMKVET
jgi:hypothetical protein